ncbi:hypothetical protein DSUL_60270 [Desulfovibrionales bacterium]
MRRATPPGATITTGRLLERHSCAISLERITRCGSPKARNARQTSNPHK